MRHGAAESKSPVGEVGPRVGGVPRAINCLSNGRFPIGLILRKKKSGEINHRDVVILDDQYDRRACRSEANLLKNVI
jgi:hypothetical protein